MKLVRQAMSRQAKNKRGRSSSSITNRRRAMASNGGNNSCGGDDAHITKVAHKSKLLKLERSKFGQHAFFQEVPRKEDGEDSKDAYAELIGNHGAV